MFETQNILASSKPLLNSIQLQAMQEAKALKELELKKEQQVLKDKVDELDSKISKAVAQTSVSTPAPAKSMTLIHVGLLAGGVLGGYLLFKFMNK